MIDRPNSPQSVLLLARVLPLAGHASRGMEPLDLANEVIGNGFLSRLNTQPARGEELDLRHPQLAAPG